MRETIASDGHQTPDIRSVGNTSILSRNLKQAQAKFISSVGAKWLDLSPPGKPNSTFQVKHEEQICLLHTANNKAEPATAKLNSCQYICM